MDYTHARQCLQLHGLTSLDDVALTRLLLRSGSPGALLAGESQLWRKWGMSVEAMGELAGRQGGGAADLDRQLATLAELGGQVLAITDLRYPPLLRQIPDPPPFLYVRGDAGLLCQAQLAMVGSRKASAAGLKAAGAVAAALVRAGLIVTSGLALGIDSAGHRGALSGGGESVAVMATGIDRVYPARHRDLARELEETGCLVSEFPLGTPPAKYNFPRRNRIVSGLALGVLVVEAALPSGSLITARTALEQGREVFALPWSIYHAGGAGCLHLLRDGAKLVESLQDILEELGPLYALQQELTPLSVPAATSLELSATQQRLLQLIGDSSVSAEALGQLTASTVARVLADLTALEVRGMISRDAGGYRRY